jgi:hypothetical protein
VEAEVQEILRRDDAVEATELPALDAAEETAAGQPAGGGVRRKPGRPATRRASQIVAVENQLRRALGVKVVVHANGKGAGRIVIPFADLDEFQRLLDHITE